MSDPLSKHEIEDVLSSIRRLVADERRDSARDLRQPLVLTPALRVEPLPQPVTPAAVNRNLRASLEETIAELEAAVAATSRPAASVAASSAASPVGDPAALARFEAELAGALGRPLPPMAELEPPTNDLAARIAEAAARVRRRGPVGAEPPPVEEDDLQWAAAGEPVPDAAPGAVRSPDTPAADPASDWQDEPRQVRRLHLAGGLDWQPPPAPSAAGEGWRPVPETPEAPAAEEDSPLLSLADMSGGAGEEYLLDEAALKALISQTLRDELQGVLGERITQSVRKMVRREIQLALTSKGLD